MFRTIFAFVGVLALATLSVSAQAQDTARGVWLGELDANGMRLRLEVTITQEAGGFEGLVVSKDQNNARIPMADIMIDDEVFQFELPEVNARFRGTWSEDRQSVSGTFIQGTGNLPLTIRKQPQEPAPNSTDSLLELEETVQWYIDKEHAVGAELLIIDHGEEIFHKSFGMADVEEERPWQNNTLCNIRSMTKPITSAAAQILIDRGKLNLDEPVSTYLKSFDNEKSRAITVRQVLTHRSGLPLTNLLRVDQFDSLEEQVDTMGKAGPQFEPDSKFWYSDAGTDVVGRLVEVASGELLHEFVQREILTPLEMSNTLYGIDPDDSRLAQAASLYLGRSGNWTRFWKYEKPLYPFAWGSQTIYSTTTDYAKFLRMLMDEGSVGDKQILSPEAVKRMTAPVSKMKMLGSDAPYPTGFRGLETRYGQMLVTHRPKGDTESAPVILGHSGSDGTNAWAWPERDLIILYFTQSRGGTTALKIEDPIDRLLLHPGSEVSVPAELKPFTGTYVANFGNFENAEFVVSARDGKLFLDVPGQMNFELAEPDEDGFRKFVIVPDRVKVLFVEGESGAITGMQMHQGNEVFELPREGSPRVQELARERMQRKSADQDRKQEMEQASTTGKLREAWVGRIDLGGIQPVMQFRIVETRSGDSIAFFDSVTEGRTGFEAKWTLQDSVLKFEVDRIGLTFEGTVNEAGDTAEGTWSQGGRSVPLTLKKQSQVWQAGKDQ